MDNLVIIISAAVAALLVGYFLGYYMKIRAAEKKANDIIEDAEKDAEIIKQKKILQAQDEAMKQKAEIERQAAEKNNRLTQWEQKLKQKDNTVNQLRNDLTKKQKEAETKKAEYDSLKENLDRQLEKAEVKNKELEEMHRKAVENLEAIAGISAAEAKQQLKDNLIAEAKTEALSLQNDIIEDAKMAASKEAKKIVIQTIQRVGAETAIENAVTVFNIDNDEIKGRIIGREGRNIRALEAATGIEIIVDDTPEAIVLSGFDPV
ncbi:MAG: DUF3552 domain-containing protein, partial [Bacteroidales bacterium]|nr:DUF3552 domain-containing protein [Bacteroidales bacterium]